MRRYSILIQKDDGIFTREPVLSSEKGHQQFYYRHPYHQLLIQRTDSIEERERGNYADYSIIETKIVKILLQYKCNVLLLELV